MRPRRSELGWKDPCSGRWRGPAELLSDPHMGQGILRPSPVGHWLPSLRMLCISVFLSSDSLKFTCFCYSRKKQKVNTRLQPSQAPKPSLFCLPQAQPKFLFEEEWNSTC